MNAPAPQPAVVQPAGDKYWMDRKDSVYLHVAQQICLKFGSHADSVIDIGSNATPTLEWHRAYASRLVSVDLRKPYAGAGVESLKLNFFTFEPNARFDLATCFQVLEHVDDPRRFAHKILDVSSTAIVSVPYKWPRGKCKYHVQDTVDEDKMLRWFGKAPVFRYIAKELNGVRRLIHVYRNDAAAAAPSDNGRAEATP